MAPSHGLSPPACGKMARASTACVLPAHSPAGHAVPPSHPRRGYAGAVIVNLDLTNPPVGRSVLLHCRPRMVFHLGHLRMLNVLYALLLKGCVVTILTIPYIEHEERNRTVRQRLNEDQVLTQAFYTNYLGFRQPQLRVLSADELDLGRLSQEYSRTYSQMATEGSPGVRSLIDKHPHQWTSPNIPFVGKTLAAIETIGADMMVCGTKHAIISAAFDEVLGRVGTCGTQPFLFEDLLDLRLRTGMDRTDSPGTYIELTDQPDFVLSKLHTIDDEPDSRHNWLTHFERLVLDGLPERLREDIPGQFNDDTERTFALIQLIKNSYRHIPYAQQPTSKDFSLEFGSYGDQLLPHDREVIRRLSQGLFPSLGVSKATVYRLHTSGRSGSAVLGVRETLISDAHGTNVSRNSVIKIGDPIELRGEKEAYERYIAPKRTSAFTEVLTASSLVDDRAAIVYRDAAQYAGVEGTVDDLYSLLRPSAPSGRFREVFRSLVHNHLYPTLYSAGDQHESGSLRYVVNEFWPAELLLEARALGDMPATGETIQFNHTEEWRTATGIVAEVQPNIHFVRVYTAHSHAKIDLDVSQLSEEARARCILGDTITVHGRVTRTRRAFFESAVAALGDPALVPPAMHVYDQLDSLSHREQHHYLISAVHGDLHAGNVLIADGRPYIIDYGKTRGGYPALYDIATLVADLKVRHYAERLAIDDVRRLERALAAGRRPLTGTGRDVWQDLRALEYSSWSAEMPKLGLEEGYNVLLGAIALGRLKFDSTVQEKRVAIELARACVERISGHDDQSSPNPIAHIVRGVRSRIRPQGSTKGSS